MKLTIFSDRMRSWFIFKEERFLFLFFSETDNIGIFKIVQLIELIDI